MLSTIVEPTDRTDDFATQSSSIRSSILHSSSSALGINNMIQNIIQNHFIIFFLVLWVTLNVIISHLSGWWKLFKSYKNTELNNKKKYYLKSTRIRNGISYSNCINFTIGNEGVKFSMIPFFLMHPSFTIPWKDIKQYEIKKKFRTKVLTIQCSALKDKEILLFGTVAETCYQQLTKLRNTA